MRHSDFVDALAQCDDLIGGKRRSKSDAAADLDDLRTTIVERILSDAPEECRLEIIRALKESNSPLSLREALERTYLENNWIEFRDTGRGMSREDLFSAYLVIGTASRRKDLDAALAKGASRAPFLGEKGVGRLSAMKLGSLLEVQTATAGDRRWNTLHVDWAAFEDLDKLVGDIEIKPRVGGRKGSATESGTTIRIQRLNANWSPTRIKYIAAYELARLWDPFSRDKRRFRVVVVFNGARVEIPRFDRAILGLAHARATGTYSINAGRPQLELVLWCGDLGHGNPPEERRIPLELIDLRSLTKDSAGISASALRSVGPFSFNIYWYNRQRLRGVESIGELKRVSALHKQWSGIMLFRDGYRVLPYGEDEDDWLGLDRRALASSGYKLSKAQFIGLVSISRTGNPELIDQTNRQGLKDCDEKRVIIEVMQFVIQDRLDKFLEEIASANDRSR